MKKKFFFYAVPRSGSKYFFKKLIFFEKILQCGSRNASKAQASLEYLLLLAAFFSALGIILPSASFSIQQFFSANDVVIAKNSANQLQEQCSLFRNLADGSKTIIEVIPSKAITVFSQASTIIFSASEKDFSVDCFFAQFFQQQEFASKFFVVVEKQSGVIKVNAFQK